MKMTVGPFARSSSRSLSNSTNNKSNDRTASQLQYGLAIR